MKEKCRVLILSKDRLAGEALRLSLARGAEYEVDVRAYDEAPGAPGEAPEVVILSFPDHGPLALENSLVRHPRAKHVIVADGPEVERQLRWLEEGADGIVDQARFDLLPKALREIRSGVLWAPRKVVSRLALNARSAIRTRAAAKVFGSGPQWTERQRDLLGLLVAGCSNAEIAERLRISELTVKRHLSGIYRRLGVRDRLQATLKVVDGVVRGSLALPPAPAAAQPAAG